MRLRVTAAIDKKAANDKGVVAKNQLVALKDMLAEVVDQSIRKEIIPQFNALVKKFQTEGLDEADMKKIKDLQGLALSYNVPQ